MGVIDASGRLKKMNKGIEVNKLDEKAKASLKKRVITSIIGLAIVIPAIILGDWYFTAVILFFTAVGVIEIIRCAKKKYSRIAYVVMFILCVSITFWPVIVNAISWGIEGKIATFDWHIYNGFTTLAISLLLFVVSVFALFYVIMWDANFTVRDACFLFTIGFLMSLGFQGLLYIRSIPLVGRTIGGGYYNLTNTFEACTPLVYLLIATFATDIGAYFIGMLFGKRKVNERISPNKTWAGFFGGLVVSTILSFTFGIVLAACNLPMLPIFDLSHWYNILILSILIPPFATLGDFVFSAIKRYYGIKDFGKLLPGHGGVLDRCDSVLFSSLVMALYVVIGLWAHNGFTSPLYF